MEWKEIVAGGSRRSRRLANNSKMPVANVSPARGSPPASKSDSSNASVICDDDPQVVDLASDNDNHVTGRTRRTKKNVSSLPSTDSNITVISVNAGDNKLSSSGRGSNPPPRKAGKPMPKSRKMAYEKRAKEKSTSGANMEGGKAGVQSNHSPPAESDAPAASASNSTQAEYVLFFDPDRFINDLIGNVEDCNDLETHTSTQESEHNGNVSEGVPDTSGNTFESPSPQPCSSRSCFTQKRKIEESVPNGKRNTSSKKVRFSDAAGKNKTAEKNPHTSSEDESDDSVVHSSSKSKVKTSDSKNKSRKSIISSESDGSSSSSMFEAVVVVRKKVKPSSSEPTPSTSQSGNKSHQKKVNKRHQRSKRSSKKRPATIDIASDSTSSEDERESSVNSGTTSNNRNRKRGTVRYKTRSTGAGDKRKDSVKLKKEEAFELLRRKREEKAKKPKRVTPEKTTSANEKESDDDEDSSDSSYTSGSSPCPIVDDAPPDGSDFDCSTPSSSSVTASGETDEEPDLEIGGSEGEKDLKEDEKNNESEKSEDDEEAKSHSSSSDGDSPDDGQNDDRCILCKNLGSVNIEGRSLEPNTSWCKCGECQVFSSEVRDYDLVCCREIKTVRDFVEEELEDSKVCVTKHARFDRDVMQNEGYARSVSKHQEARRFQTSYFGNFAENYTCGKANYKKYDEALRRFQDSDSHGKMIKSLSSYLHWIFDSLGNESRQMVIPACVQNKIRKKFKIPDCLFHSFHADYNCPVGSHCRLAQ